MKTFRDLANESLSYKINPEEVLKFDGIDNYIMATKGSILLYSDENTKKPIFSVDTDKNKLIVLKQGWQLMNVKRGY